MPQAPYTYTHLINPRGGRCAIGIKREWTTNANTLPLLVLYISHAAMIIPVAPRSEVDDDNHTRPGVIVGATVGSVVGAFIIFFALFWWKGKGCIARRRRDLPDIIEPTPYHHPGPAGSFTTARSGSAGSRSPSPSIVLVDGHACAIANPHFHPAESEPKHEHEGQEGDRGLAPDWEPRSPSCASSHEPK